MATQVAIGDLESWLSNQPQNTENTPYEIEVTGLTSSNFHGIRQCDIQQAVDNAKRFVDLSATVIPEGIQDLALAFMTAMSPLYGGVVYPPKLPSTTQTLYRAFERQQILKRPPLIPDGVSDMRMTFKMCTALQYKSIIPSSVTSDTDCYEDVTATEWRGTKSQAEAFVDSTNPVAIAVDPDTLEVICTVVVFSNLNTWLGSQPANTQNTPYKLDVAGLTTSDIGSSGTSGKLGYVLNQNNTKFVDLSYTQIPNGVTDMSYTFESCVSLVSAPVISNGVTNMTHAFVGCTSLVNAPVIPNGVTDMSFIFYECIYLVNSPIIPDSVTDLSYAFYECESLATAPIIPNGITNLEMTFYGCTSLVNAPVIPDGVTNMNYTFRNCASLVNAPIIPNSVTNLSYTFSGCTSLVNAPIIPNSVTVMMYIFYGCTSLINAPAIPSSVTDIRYAFYGCTSLVNAPVIPDGVTNMRSTFQGCATLSYKPIIPSSVTTTTDCYTGVSTPNWKGTESQAVYFNPSCTDDAEIKVYNNDRITYEYSYYNIGISTLSTYLAGLDANTVATAYKIYIRGLTTSNASDIKTALIANPTKYVDLEYTTIPSGTDWDELFWDCSSLVVSPDIPSGVTSLNYTYGRCTNLGELPIIPNGVLDMDSTFEDCNFTTAPTLPNTVTNLTWTFGGCSNLQEAPVLPSGVVILRGTFALCSSLKQPPVIPSGVTDMQSLFSGCTSLEEAPDIPSGVTNITKTFKGCTSIESISSIPASVTEGEDAFYNCSSLKSIEEFGISASALDSSDFEDMFKNCSSLTEIGHKAEQKDSFRIVYLDIDQNSVAGKIFTKNTEVIIPQTTITKSTLTLPCITDELMFTTAMSASDIEDIIKGTPSQDGMLTTHYSWYRRTVIPPTGNNFVLYAKDPDKFRSNINFGGGGADITVYDTIAQAEADLPNLGVGEIVGTEDGTLYNVVDQVQTGNMNSVTSNAVARALQNVASNIPVYATDQAAEEDLANLEEGQLVGIEEGDDGVIDEVVNGDMRAVTSNAIYNVMNTWVDISNQVTLTIQNNNASVTIGYKKVYMCGSLLKFDIYCDCNTSGLSEGSDLCQIVVTSSLFTLPYSLARSYNPSYYGGGVTTVGMNVYNNDNGVITARLTKGGITIGDFSFCATIPCLIS